MDATSKPQLLA